MTDEQIDDLKSLLAQGEMLLWRFDDEDTRQIKLIGKAPNPKDEWDLPEPSEVAYFWDGKYVALWNCEPRQFIVASYIFE